MSEHLSPEYEAKIREHVATMSNYSLGNLFARDLLAEIDRLRARTTELEQAALEGRGALGALCYDLEDPGSNAFGALHMLSQATFATTTPQDDALAALARRDADKLDAAAESIVASCPDHGDADEAWMDCHCVAAEELNRQANALRKGGA